MTAPARNVRSPRSRRAVAIGTLLLAATAAASASAAPNVTRVAQHQQPLGASTSDVDFSPDGRRLAVLSSTYTGYTIKGKPANEDRLRIFEVAASGKIALTPGGKGDTMPRETNAYDLDYSPNGNVVVVAAQGEDRLRAYRVTSDGRILGSESASTKQPNGKVGRPDLVAVSPGGALVATTVLNGDWLMTFRLLSDGGLRRVATFRMTTSIGTSPTGLAFSRDGRHLTLSSALCGCRRTFAVSPSGTLKVVETGKRVFFDLVYRPGGGTVGYDAFSRPDDLFSFGPRSGGFGPQVDTAKSSGGSQRLEPSPGGRFIASAELGKLDLALYGVDAPGRVSLLHRPTRDGDGHNTYGYQDVAYSPDGRTVVAGGSGILKNPPKGVYPPVGKVDTYRVSSTDANLLTGSVGVRYLGLEYTSGGIRSAAVCTMGAPCTWSVAGLPPGLKATTATTGGATATITGVPTKVGAYPITVALRQKGKIVKTVRDTIRILAPPSVNLASPAPGERLRQGSQATAAYACKAEAGTTLADPGGCTGPVPHRAGLDTTTPGAKTFTVTATDAVGGTRTVTHDYVVVPPPSVAVDGPTDGATYRTGQVVAAAYSCAPGAGATIAGCSGPVASGVPVDTATPGPHAFTVTATDDLGQTSTRTVTYTVAAPPTVAIASPANGAAYPVGAAVTADYRCAAGASGVLREGADGCSGTVPQGGMLDTSTPGTRTVTVTATDTLGQATTVTSTYRVVAGPGVVVDTPVAGGRYAVGADVRADFSCTAGPGGTLRPGADGCSGTVPDGEPLDTATPGVKTFTATATDALGQETTVTRTYTVVPPPTVTITTPVQGETYDMFAPPTVDFSCAAGAGGALLPGTTGCSGTQPDGALLAPDPLGTRTFTVTATDDLGQVTEKTVTYVMSFTS